MILTFLRRVRASVSARAAAIRRHRHNRVPALVGRPEAFDLKRQFQKSFLLERGLLPQHTLLDFGCGVLRGGIPLIEHLAPGNYCGIDVRDEVLRVARREVRRHGLTAKRPQLVHGQDLPSLSLGRRFDFAWSFSVLFHLSDEHLDRCLQFVSRHLKEGGTFFANVNIGTRPSVTWLEFPVVWRPLDDYERRAVAAGLKVSVLGQLSDFGHRSPSDPEEDLQTMLAFAPLR